MWGHRFRLVLAKETKNCPLGLDPRPTPKGQFLLLFFNETGRKCASRALDWPSSVCGYEVMALKQQTKKLIP